MYGFCFVVIEQAVHFAQAAMSMLWCVRHGLYLVPL